MQLAKAFVVFIVIVGSGSLFFIIRRQDNKEKRAVEISLEKVKSNFATVARNNAANSSANQISSINSAEETYCLKGWCGYKRLNGCQCHERCEIDNNCCPNYEKICGKKNLLAAPLITKITPSSLELKWKAEEQTSKTVSLQILYEENGLEWTDIKTFDTEKEEVNLKMANIKPENRYHFRIADEKGNVLSRSSNAIATNSCVVIVQLEEETSLPFLVESLKDQFDFTIIIDTGSEDLSLELVKELFPEDIRSGKIEIFVFKNGRGKMGIARQFGIDRSKALGCRYFVPAEADSVYFDKGAKDLGIMAKNLPDDVKYPHYYWKDLLWYRAKTTSDWFKLFEEEMKAGITTFYEQYTSFDATYLMRTEGASAVGEYSDEAAGKAPERIVYGTEWRGSVRYMQLIPQVFHVHLSNCRPNDRKLVKYRMANVTKSESYAYEMESIPWLDKYFPTGFSIIPETMIRSVNKVRKAYEKLLAEKGSKVLQQ